MKFAVMCLSLFHTSLEPFLRMLVIEDLLLPLLPVYIVSHMQLLLQLRAFLLLSLLLLMSMLLPVFAVAYFREGC